MNFLDKAIATFNPRLAAERMVFREFMASYRGGVPTRASDSFGGSESRTGQKVPSTETNRSMRDRARNLDRNNALASSVLDRSVENVVGTEIVIRPATDSDEFNREAEDLWKDGFCRNCDIRGMNDFAGIQQLTYRAWKRDGDVGTLLVDRGDQPKLQSIEGDYIESPAGKYNPAMVDGVELNEVGGPIRYWVRGDDPNKPFRFNYVGVDPRNFIFLTNADRLNGVRGASQFAQGFELFDQISGYLEGTVLAAKIASYAAIVIKKNNAANIVSNLGTRTNTAGVAQKKRTWEPGQMIYLEPGEDISTVNPNQPTQSFPDSIAAFARFVGLKFGLTIEQVLLDFSRTSYSSSRAARLQVQSTIDTTQRQFAEQFVCRIYRWWISKTVKSGGFKTAAPEKFWDHEWIPVARPGVDQAKEIDYAERAVALGIDARSYISTGNGYQFSKLCEQNQRDREMMQKHNLPVVDTATTGAPDPELERIKAEADAYGVAVRAGVVTPQPEDETQFRERLNLPAMAKGATDAWEKDKGARRPITLTPPPGEPAAVSTGVKPDESEQ